MTNPDEIKTRLKQLRDGLTHQKIDAVLIPRGDSFQGEEVPLKDNRLHYISGFTGSAGLAIVAMDKAALFSDGRYTLQMSAQTSSDWSCHTMPEETVMDWLTTNMAGGVLGVDPWLITLGSWRQYEKNFRDKAFTLKTVDQNPIDTIWADQPTPPKAKAWDYPDQYAGQSRADKIKALQAELKSSGADHMLITGPDQLNWLLNIRGNDLDHTPVFLAFALLEKTGLEDEGIVTVFGDAERLSEIDQSHVKIIPADDMTDYLVRFEGKKIAIDPSTCPYVLASLLDGKTTELESPITHLKAKKNQVEISGFRQAHQRDAVAMVRFLSWLDRHAGDGLREVEAGEKLHQFRDDVDMFICPSFASICGSGSNGAIVHYRAETGKDSVIARDTLFLVDSGGQYHDATTDITRTVIIGTPTDAMKHDFTHVLKGHIALDQAVFPEGTTGVQLDAITRAPLWAAGMDYAHGTGHGVGCCLNVHEGPANFSKRGIVAIKQGMVLSNEPGFYIEGQYGIRIENLIIAHADDQAKDDGKEGYLSFEHVTLVPIDKRLIDPRYLTEDERAWVDAYHAEVFDKIGPSIDALGDAEVSAWFKDATSRL